MHVSPADVQERLARAAATAASHGIDALLISPGPDLGYLTGYDAIPLERLTCLVLRPGVAPTIVVPLLERPAAQASPLGDIDTHIVTWTETENPFDLVASLVPDANVVAVDDRMWASKVLSLRHSMPGVEQRPAGPVLRELRMHKSASEIESLAAAAAAIDSVHAQVPSFIRPGRTEREVGADIADAILRAGHKTVDFVIVASGPNGASPHHELSDRVINVGDPIVVDIGGTMPDGYCSDETRMYALGHAPQEFLDYYSVLQAAQQAAVNAVRPGVTAASIDAAARDYLTEAGWGEWFIHRTGHGIGLETHEEPYIVSTNLEPLAPGMAFSIEPGVYLPGKHGARIEDIVVCTQDGVRPLNRQTHDLVIVPV